jgi:PAS domain S-box-containing protein
MSKRQRHLKQRLDELFSTAEDSEAVAANASAAPADQSPTPIEAEQAARPLLDDRVRLLTVIEQLPLPAYVKDHEHTWVAVNTAYGELIGHASADLIGHTDKEQADEAWQLDDRVLDTGQPEESQETTTLPDGSIRTRRFTRTALFNDQREVQYVMGLVQEQNVAQHFHADEDLSKFKLGIDRTNAAVTITDTQGTIVYVNPAYEKIYGYSREDVIGQNPSILKSGHVSPEEYHRFWAKLLAGEPVTGEIINKAKDGRLVSVETNNTPILDESGNITGFLSIQYDISERKQAEAERERLLKSEAQRAVQLQTATAISNAVSTMLDVNELLPFVVNVIQQRFNLYYVGLFLVNETYQSAVLRAATGEIGRNMLERGYQLPIDDRSMIGWCIGHETARIALDVGDDAIRFSNPDLPETHSELALPLISRGQVLGAMSTQSTETAAFNPQDITVLQTMADQVATAIANAQLLEQAHAASQQAEERLREVQFMQAVGQAVSSTLDLATVVNVIFQTLEQDMGFTHAALAILDKPSETITIVRASGTAIGLQGLTRTIEHLQGDILLDILQKGETEVIDGWDNRLDREIWEREGHAALVRAFVPLRLRGEPVGILEVGYWRADRAQITSDEVRLLSGIADQMAIAVGNARLLEQAQTALAETTRRSEQLVVLNEMARALGATLNADTILNVVYTYTSRLMNTDSFFVALYDATAQTLTFPLSLAYNDRQPVQVEPRPLKAGLTDYIIRHRQPLLLSDNVQAHMTELGIEFLALGNAKPALSWLGVPMIFSDQVLGAIVVQSITTPGLYREIDRDLLLAVAGQTAIALNNAHLFDESQRRITELAVVNEISRALTSAEDVSQLFGTIHQQVGRLFDTSNFYIATYGGGDEWSLDYQFERNQLLPPARHKIGRGFTSYILQTKQPLLIRSAQENTAFHEKHDLPKIGETAKSWMGVPLIVTGNITGVMGIQSYEREGLYDEHNVTLFSTIGTQAAAAIQNTRLLQEARVRANELAALNDLSRTLASQLSVHQVLAEVWHGVSHLLDTTNFYIALYDAERQEISFPINASESVLDQEITVMPASQGLTGYIIRTKQPLLIKEDVQSTVSRLELKNVGADSQSYLGVPIAIGDQILGVVAIQSYTKTRLYNEHDQNLLMAIAGQTAIALQNARLFEQTQKQADEAAALNEIIQEVSQRVNLEHVLETAYRHIRQLMPTDAFIVALLTGNGSQLYYPLIYDEGQRFPPRSGEARPETNIGRVILNGQPLLINRAEEELDSETSAIDVSALGNEQRPSASLLYAPLKSEQKTIGALSIQSYQPNAYSPGNVTLLERIANQLAIAIQNAQLFEETSRRNSELATLNQIIGSASETLDLRTLLNLVLQQTLDDFGFDGGLITLYNDQRHKLERVVRTGLPGQIPEDPAQGLENSLCNYVFETKESLVIEDFRQGAPIDVSGEIEAGYFSYIGIPLESHGHMLGTWCGFRKVAGPFDKNTFTLLQTISHQVSFAIENARLFTQTQATLAETEQLYAASQRLTAATNLQEAVAALAEGVLVADINRAALWLFERNEQDQVTAAIVSAGWYSGQGVPVMSTGTRLSSEVIKAMSLVLTTEPLFSGNLKTDRRIDPSTAALLQQQNIGAIAILPLWVTGHQIGAFLLEAEGPHTFTDAEIRPYVSLSQQLATIIYNQQLFEQIQRTAKREQTLRELTARVRGSSDPDTIVRTAVRELGIALGRRTFIRLGDAAQLIKPPAPRETVPLSDSGSGTESEGGQ